MNRAKARLTAMVKVSLASVVVSFGMMGPAFGYDWWWPPTDEIVIVPSCPSSGETVSITLKGQWPDSCIPPGSTLWAQDDDLFFDVATRSGDCLAVITPWDQSQTVGPLAVGRYLVWARRVSGHGDPSTYALVGSFRVLPPEKLTTYRFMEHHSNLIISGGLAGIHETKSINGYFRLLVDGAGGTASFEWVDATYSDGGLVGGGDLGKLFNMTELKGTIVSTTEIDFEGHTADRFEWDVNLRLTFVGDTVHLTGSFPPPGTCCDFFFYELDAWAEEVLGPCDYYLAGDLNGDCKVNMADLSILAANWMVDCSVDPDDSGCVPK